MSISYQTCCKRDIVTYYIATSIKKFTFGDTPSYLWLHVLKLPPDYITIHYWGHTDSIGKLPFFFLSGDPKTKRKKQSSNPRLPRRMDWKCSGGESGDLFQWLQLVRPKQAIISCKRQTQPFKYILLSSWCKPKFANKILKIKILQMPVDYENLKN